MHIFRSLYAPPPSNDNLPAIGVRAEWIVAACEFIRSRSLKLKRRALRLVKP